MQTLLIEADGRVLRFDTERAIKIGRSIEADVVLTAASVSRAHAELRPTTGGWLLVDAGSSGGTFVDGARVTETPIGGAVTVQCGPESPGSSLVVTPEQQAPPELTSAPSHAPAQVHEPAPADSQRAEAPSPGQAAAPQAAAQQVAPQPAAAGPGGSDMTIVPGSMQAPSGAPMQRTGPDLLVVADGREHRFRHPATLSLGRHPDCDVVVTDRACSRHHGQIAAVPGGWVYVNHSDEGSFVDGRPIAQESFDESLSMRLGHPVAGPEVSLVPILSAEEEVARIARKRRNKQLKIAGVVGAVAAVFIAGIVTVALVSGDGGPSGGDGLAELTAAERDAAKAATVLLTYEVELAGESGFITGSGSIVSDEGLILTNAHVVSPQADGLAEQYGPELGQIPEPELVNVHLTDPEEGYKTGDPDYRAEVVTADGVLDAAVIQIVQDEDGSEVAAGDLDLPTMPIGDSDAMSTGDDVTVMGFPGIARSRDLDPTEVRPAVSVTTGVVSTFLDTERLGERSEIDTDARISQGNSGGAAVNNDGELIGVPSAISGSEDAPVVSGRVRPVALLDQLISEARDSAE